MSAPIFRQLALVALLLTLPLRPAEASPWVSDAGRHVAFSADYNGTELTVWNLAEGREVCRLIDSHGAYASDDDPPVITACAISDAAGLVATISQNSLSIWNLTTGELLWSDENKFDSKFIATRCVAFYPDGRHLVTINERGFISVRRSIDGTEPVVMDETGNPGTGMQTLATSPDGDRIYAYVRRNDQKTVLRCWDSDDGSLLGDFVVEEGTYRGGAYSAGTDVVAEVARDGDRAAIIIWDAQTFTELRRIPAGSQVGPYPMVLEDRESVVFGAVEYDLKTGEVVSQHAIHEDLLASSHYGRHLRAIPGTSLYCWTNYSDRRVLFLGHRQPPVSGNFALSFQALHGRREASVILGSAKRGIVTGQPQYVEVFSMKNEGSRGKPNIRWSYERVAPSAIQQDKAGVAAVLNDLLTPLPPRGERAIDRSKPRLFVFAVGVSDYELDEYDLRFCAKDASDLAARLQAERGKQFGDVQVTVLTDRQVTPDAVRDGFAWLQRSSTPKDLVVVFFSGHGYRATKGLYYLTHLGDTENIQNTCINWEEVARSFAGTKAKQILFLSDCCHAGSFSRDRYVTQEKLVNLMADAKHVGILASSTGEENSLELDRLEQGAFTHAILEALNGQADSSGDGKVAWDEVEEFVCRRVPELTDATQHPTVVKPAAAADTLVLSTSPADETARPAPATTVIQQAK